MRSLLLFLALAQIYPSDGMQSVLAGPTASGPVIPNVSWYAGFTTPGVFTSPVTIEHGGPITVTRAAPKYCDLTGTGATLTVGGNDTLCVEPNGALIETQQTNYIPWSEDFSQWLKVASGIAQPTVTTDQVTAPDGTITADQIDMPGTAGAGTYSFVYMPNLFPGNAATFSMWMRTASGTATTWLGCIHYGIGWVARQQVTITTTWQRFSVVTPPGLQCREASVGTAFDLNGASVATTFYVWGSTLSSSYMNGFAHGAQTSYIKTVGAAATRPADVLISNGSFPMSPTEYSISADATIITEHNGGAGQNLNVLLDPATTINLYRMPVYGLPSQVFETNAIWGSSHIVDSPNTYTVGTPTHFLSKYAGTTLSTCIGGTCGTGAYTMSTYTDFATVGVGTVYTGGAGSQLYLDGWLQHACIDKTSTGCL